MQPYKHVKECYMYLFYSSNCTGSIKSLEICIPQSHIDEMYLQL